MQPSSLVAMKKMEISELNYKNTLVRSGIANTVISKTQFQFDVQNIKAILSLETFYLCLYEMERDWKSFVPCVHLKSLWSSYVNYLRFRNRRENSR